MALFPESPYQYSSTKQEKQKLKATSVITSTESLKKERGSGSLLLELQRAARPMPQEKKNPVFAVLPNEVAQPLIEED